MSSKKRDILEIILAVLAIFLVIISIGVLFSGSKKKQVSESNPIKDLENELEKVKNKIAELEPQQKKLESKERKLFLWARILIGLLIVCANLVYFYIQEWHFDLGNHLNINSAGLLVYGFSAFILYGSIEKFLKAIKISAMNYLRRNNINIWEELKRLRERKTFLESELKKIKSKNNEPLSKVKT